MQTAPISLVVTIFISFLGFNTTATIAHRSYGSALLCSEGPSIVY
jgi:hypothetical protein